VGVDSTGARVRAQVYGLVFVAVFVAFSPALRNGFVNFDDDINLLQNEHYRGLGARNLGWMFGTFYVGHYMPITWLSLALDHQVWGMNPFGYHLTSILLHAVSAMVLAATFTRLLARTSAPAFVKLHAAAAGSLFHSLHPLRVESVAWATERRDVLAGLFFGLAVYAYLRRWDDVERRGFWLAASLASFALSLLSKASGMTLPLVLVALDLLQPGQERGRIAWLEKLPYFALGLAGAAIGWLGQIYSTQAIVPIAEFGVLQRLAQASYAVVFYLEKTLWPLGLSPLYLLDRNLDPFAIRYVLSATLIAAATLATWLLRRQAPGLFVGWIAYLLLVAPFSGLAQAGSQIAADRYTYLAAMPFGALFAGACCAAFARPARRVAYSSVAVLLVVLAALSARQCAHWRSSVDLWKRVVEVEPESDLGHHRLGVSLHQAGRYQEALQAYERALLLRPTPDDANARYDRALTWLSLERMEEAQADLDLVLAAKPSHAAALEVAADLLQSRGEEEEAIRLYRVALASDPLFADGYLALARRLRSAVRPEEAREVIELGLSVAPKCAPLRNQLGVLLLEQGNPLEAELQLRAALSFEPDEPGYLTNLGLALEKLGRIDEARDCWRRALEIEPRHNPARRLLDRGARAEP
jgi:tetratricopeptide (TPR) repeat protein